MKKIGLALSILLLALALPFSVGCGTGANERTKYEITCSLDGNILTGTENVEFTNFTDNTFKELKFNLFGNAFRQDASFKPIATQYVSRAYPHGVSYGDMKINSVKLNGEGTSFEICGQDKNILLVELGSELFPGEKVCAQIEFTLTLANVVARTGINDHTVNLGNFYPILCGIDENGFYECVYYSSGDPFYSDCSDYKVKIELDGKYKVASSGGLISVENKGEKNLHYFELNNARSFAMVASQNFSVLSDDSTGVKINYYYYKDNSPNASLDYAIKSIKLFNELYGKYPYDNYSVVQTEFIQGGMEYPSLVMIADDLESKAYGEVIVHETAHQWWQTTVGNNEIKYGFLDEGLAEYSVVAFYEKYSEYNMNRADMVSSAERTYKVFCSVYDKIFGNVNTVMLRSLSEFNGEYEYVNMAYIKPCIMYEYLRNSVGDELFFKGLRRYFSEYSFKNATPDDLVGAFEKVGADTNGFFQSFFDGKVII